MCNNFINIIWNLVILEDLQLQLLSLFRHPQPIFHFVLSHSSRSQWPRGLRRRSAAAHLLRSWVRIPPGAWMFVCCECCVLSGRGLCDELITRPDESYRLWCVVVCDLETSRMRRPWPALGRSATEEKSLIHKIILSFCKIRPPVTYHVKHWHSTAVSHNKVWLVSAK